VLRPVGCRIESRYDVACKGAAKCADPQNRAEDRPATTETLLRRLSLVDALECRSWDSATQNDFAFRDEPRVRGSA
jgi:hypothetical protein